MREPVPQRNGRRIWSLLRQWGPREAIGALWGEEEQRNEGARSPAKRAKDMELAPTMR